MSDSFVTCERFALSLPGRTFGRRVGAGIPGHDLLLCDRGTLDIKGGAFGLGIAAGIPGHPVAPFRVCARLFRTIRSGLLSLRRGTLSVRTRK